MTEPTTIYECPDCGKIYLTPDPCNGHVLSPVRVFREEDVRPLWEAALDIQQAGDRRAMFGAMDNFPAPEEWKR